MHINDDTNRFKKGFAGIFLGTQVVGKQDIPLGHGVRDRTLNVPFLVTGVAGIRSGDQVKDYEFVLEALDGSDHQLCLSFDDFTAYFSTGTVFG